MNVTQGAAVMAMLFGALAVQPALADPAAEAAEPFRIAEVQEDTATAAEEAPADRPGAMQRQRMMGPGMMDDEDGMRDRQMMMRMQQMHMRMMGPGMGPMGMCPMMMQRADKDLSAEQVRAILEGQIAWTGNERLKVGSVEEKDEDTFVAEIVTVDDSLVQRMAVDRATGMMRPVN